MLTARAALQSEYAKLHKTMLVIVRDDKICRRLMTAPGVGPVVAITFKTAVDDPTRISKSKAVGPLFGLTPKKYQSGETDVTGGITCVGDMMVRTALYEAANILLSRVTRFSALKRGHGGGETARIEAGQGRARAQDRRDFASHVGRWDGFPMDESGVGLGRRGALSRRN
jgi:transposase